MAKITLLGSYSGRNAGDAAILASIMSALSKEIGDTEVSFEVPTTHPSFVEEHYGKMFKVRPVSIMPWTGSIRLLGIPTARSIKRTDITMITDGIIFDINLFNPLFNFLITLIFLVPWARLCGKKVVCYSVGIGPLDSFWGRTFARWVGNACDLIMVRDEDSRKLFRSVGVTQDIHLTADAVFLDWAASEERIEEVINASNLNQASKQDELLGINVTRYIDRWLKKSEKVSEHEEFLPSLAHVIARLRVENNLTPVLFTTQIMDADYGRKLQRLIAQQIKELTGGDWEPTLFTNETYDNHELLGLSARCRLYVGMRLHSLIIAARAGTSVFGLVYAPKVRSFLQQLGTPELAFELADISQESLYENLLNAWKSAQEIENVQQKVVGELEAGAKRAASLVNERYFFSTDEKPHVSDVSTAVSGR